MKHTCHADGCDVAVPPAMLMCARHWRMVPKPLQREVWAAYSSGQEQRKDPSVRYLDVARRAIDAVRMVEQGSPRLFA